jgi:ketosteroid isomerase-like protein
MTAERLHAFGSAWNRGDVGELMNFMTDDCVYVASIGPEPGRTYRGRAQVRQCFTEILSPDSGTQQLRLGPVTVCGTFGCVEWSYPSTGPDGTKTSVRGCDLFEFRGDKIVRKEAFRKTTR